MGLSGELADVSSDSIPILILINAVRGVSYIRYLFFCLMHTVVGLGLSHHHHHQSEPSSSSSSSSPSAAVGSGLAGLAVLADHLASNRPFVWSSQAPSSSPPATAGPASGSCVVCLEGLGEGERVRRLACCHVFHSECLDRWMVGEMNLSCPLCRSPVATEERRADAERRIGAKLVAWLSPY